MAWFSAPARSRSTCVAPGCSDHKAHPFLLEHSFAPVAHQRGADAMLDGVSTKSTTDRPIVHQQCQEYDAIVVVAVTILC